MRLDLRKCEAQEIIRGLAARADVLVQNLSPGAMERFGLGYEQLSRVNPRLIVASGTGFGSSGPYAGQPAMDLTIQARTAVMSTTGFTGGPPVRTGPAVVDFMGAAHMTAGVLAALYQRERTGQGQHVEVALQDAILPSLTSNLAGYFGAGGPAPERTGNRHGGLTVVPYNAYRSSDGWITVLCPTQAHWERLCAVIGDPRTEQDRFATMARRCDRVDEVDAIVEQWTSARTKQEVADLLASAGIPNAPVVTLPELLNDPHVAHRAVLRTMHDDEGDWLTIGTPLCLSGSPTVEPTRPPTLGQDTDQILRDELDMTVDAIAGLRAGGVI
jgi:formyl-CoA transferase